MKLQAYLTGFSSRADGSFGVRFATQELQADEITELSENLNQFGHLLFQPNTIQLEDIPTDQAEDKNKTPSKRLRNSIFVLWKQLGEPQGDFEAYYRQVMEKFIDRVKSKLD